MLNEKGEESRIFRTGEKMVLDLSYHVENKVTDAVFGLVYSEMMPSGVMELTQELTE